MEFGVSKFAMLVMKVERLHSQGIVLLDEELISETDDGGYKYLGLLKLYDTMPIRNEGKGESKIFQ